SGLGRSAATGPRLLPERFAIVGMARREVPFAEDMRAGVAEFARRRPIDEDLWQRFAPGLSYTSGNFDDAESFARLKAHLEEVDARRGTSGNRVFYISTPPESFAPIIDNLGRAGMISGTQTSPFTRVIIEKP